MRVKRIMLATTNLKFSEAHLSSYQERMAKAARKRAKSPKSGRRISSKSTVTVKPLSSPLASVLAFHEDRIPRQKSHVRLDVEPLVVYPKLNEAMTLREQQARRVKHVVAPVANKMGYQYIHNEEDYKTMGRKI